jgi:hypothetical protein
MAVRLLGSFTSARAVPFGYRRYRHSPFAFGGSAGRPDDQGVPGGARTPRHGHPCAGEP